MSFRPLEPMLASTARTTPQGPPWVYEPKLDGRRTLLYVIGGKVTVRSAHGLDITVAVPELAGIGAHLEHQVVVLDGELIAGQGRSADFYPLLARMEPRSPCTVAEKQRTTPITFVAFDLLHVDETITHLPYETRRAHLEALELLGPGWATVPHLKGPPDRLVDACEHTGIEGVVAKHRDSTYRPGERSRDWVKVKTSAWRTEHGPRRYKLSSLDRRSHRRRRQAS